MQAYVSQRQRGFTLLEFSIILLLAALLVGGVVIGKDMIASSEVRGSIAQMEEYRAAVANFRAKYTFLPGDVPAAPAREFNLASRAGTPGRGDDSGMIEGGAPGYAIPCGEGALFWNDLSRAGLIAPGLIGEDGVVGNCDARPLAELLPSSVLGHGGFVIAYGDASDYRNYFQIIAGGDPFTDVGFSDGVGAGATPIESYQIDRKVDDGFPLTGGIVVKTVVQRAGMPVPVKPAAADAGVCVVAGSTPTYNLHPVFGENVSCSPSFRLN